MSDDSASIELWGQWLQSAADRVLPLDERARASGDPAIQRSVDELFLVRKAIADRVEALRGADRRERPAVLAAPLVDDLGTPLGAGLVAAAELFDGHLADLEARLTAVEAHALATAELAARVDTDLRTAQRLATELGSEVRAVQSLAARVAAHGDLADVAPQLAAARARLEAAAAERDRVVAVWAAAAPRLTDLRAREAEIRTLAATCADKIAAPPRLAVPSVDALSLPEPSDVAGLPWAAMRARVVPALESLDRIGRAFDEAERRFRAPLAERDDLRGLVQAFRDKADAQGRAESPELSDLYRGAADELWRAPCDLAAARTAVQRYVDAVNAGTPGRTAAPTSEATR